MPEVAITWRMSKLASLLYSQFTATLRCTLQVEEHNPVVDVVYVGGDVGGLRTKDLGGGKGPSAARPTERRPHTRPWSGFFYSAQIFGWIFAMLRSQRTTSWIF